MEENSWLDIAMRDKEDRESDKQMGKKQTERQTACCYRPSACYDPYCHCNTYLVHLHLDYDSLESGYKFHDFEGVFQLLTIGSDKQFETSSQRNHEPVYLNPN